MAAPKVELRPLRSDDRDRLLIWRNSPEVARYMFTDHQISAAEHDHWFTGIEGDARRAYWIVNVDGAPAGLTNLYDIDRGSSCCAWAWYLAEPSVRGKGVGGCVGYLVIEKAFDEFGLGELSCEVLASNHRARRLYQKFGFREEAPPRRRVLKNGALEEVLELGLRAQTWAAVRPQIHQGLRAAGFLDD